MESTIQRRNRNSKERIGRIRGKMKGEGYIGKKVDYERKKRRNLENEKENEKWT
jgi:hypothetical protein